MRSTLIALVLLAACGTNPLEGSEAPSVDAALSDKTAAVRLAELEAQVAKLQKQMVTGQAIVQGLEARLKLAESTLTVHGGNLQLLDSSNVDIQGRLKLAESSITVHGGNIDFLNDSVLTIESGSTLFVNRLNDVESSQATTAAYVRGLASPGSDDPTAPLFGDDGTPNVDGAIQAIIWRMRKRPELLVQEWDSMLNDSLVVLQASPLYDAQGLEVTSALYQGDQRLGKLEGSVAHFIDDWQGEVVYLKSVDAGLAGETEALRKRADFVDGQVVYLDTRVSTLEGSQGQLVKDVSGLTQVVQKDLVAWKPTVDAAITGLGSDVDSAWETLSGADVDLQGQVDELASDMCKVASDVDAYANGGDLSGVLTADVCPI